ncbi:MAG: HD domain-containing protein [Bacillota bacterium]
MVGLEDVKSNAEIDIYIRSGNDYLATMGLTEHSLRHLSLVSNLSGDILEKLGFPPRQAELAAIAGYLHDIGNVVCRHDHGQSGAMISFAILGRMGMEPDELAMIVAAIGNHEEEYGYAVNPVGAALILADKSDVHRTRVRNQDMANFDVHDRVNYAVNDSFLKVNSEKKAISMELTIDLKISTVMEYFEIFLTRMVMCRRAANFLGCQFGLIINDSRLL